MRALVLNSASSRGASTAAAAASTSSLSSSPPVPPPPSSSWRRRRAVNCSFSPSSSRHGGSRSLAPLSPPRPRYAVAVVAAAAEAPSSSSSSSSSSSPSPVERRDEVLRTLSESSEISVLAVDGTRLVADACRRHGTAPTASAALGRALLGGLLMSAFKGEGEATQITFKGTGPLGGLQVVAEATGAVKGRVDNPSADPPLRESDGKLDVGGAVGGGVLAIVRSRAGGGDPYTGMTQIISGEVADDLAHYLATSEQVNCALALGVSLDKQGNVKAAGGFFAQVLPMCSEETLVSLERNIAALPAVSSFFLPPAKQKEGEGEKAEASSSSSPSSSSIVGSGGVEGLTAALLEGIGAAPGPGFSLSPYYGPCEPEGLRERMVRAAALLGEDEVRAALDANGGVMEMKCEFCQVKVEFAAEEVLEAARKAAEGKRRK